MLAGINESDRGDGGRNEERYRHGELWEKNSRFLWRQQ